MVDYKRMLNKIGDEMVRGVVPAEDLQSDPSYREPSEPSYRDIQLKRIADALEQIADAHEKIAGKDV